MFVDIDNDYPVTLTTNSKEGNNMFCPGEPIIVKCSVPNPILVWFIDHSSFVLERKHPLYLSFYLRPWGESYLYLNSSIGHLNFYRNETYVGSSLDNSHSFINSELHMHLNDGNNFIYVKCIDLGRYKFKTINIITFPGMLNIA